jgi:hypothetical protein
MVVGVEKIVVNKIVKYITFILKELAALIVCLIPRDWLAASKSIGGLFYKCSTKFFFENDFS